MEMQHIKSGPQSLQFNFEGGCNSARFDSATYNDDDSSDFEIRRTSNYSESDSDIQQVNAMNANNNLNNSSHQRSSSHGQDALSKMHPALLAD